MKERFGPDETWPQHQKPYWRSVLAEAREAGWTLTHVNAPHTFGVVTCPAGEHTFMVDGTARGGETKSREARKIIRSRCRHGSVRDGGKVRERQEECCRLLDTAEQLIANADTDLTAAEDKQQAWDELELLEIQVESASVTIQQVQAAWETVYESDGAPEPELISGHLDEAELTVGRGESVAEVLGARHPALARPLLDRVGVAVGRIAELRDRLASLREKSGSDGA